MLKLYNTLTRSIENFIPHKAPLVTMYSCGPTVYDYQHIGHMRRYVGDDILIRALRLHGYDVKHVMNITDVGHLVSDADEGEDKMEKGARKYGESVWEIAHRFEKQFIESSKALNIALPKQLLHATDYIAQQIVLIQVLEQKGYTYHIADGIYYDTSKFLDYFRLSGQNPGELKAETRIEMVEGKKNMADFALWKFSPKNEKRQMEWKSPWGIGFPGWHIECSAMSLDGLFHAFNKTFHPEKVETIDVHTGGIDHIAIHHTDEIAQSEAATGKKFVKYWVHHNFLLVDGQKMSKSLGNVYTVQDVIDRGFDPLSLRYLYLQTHYRQEMNFTWESLDAAGKALDRLRAEVANIKSNKETKLQNGRENKFELEFINAVNDDLNTAKALAIVWEMVKSDYPANEKLSGLKKFDNILGLNLMQRSGNKDQGAEIPQKILDLVQKREAFRTAGDFASSDQLRKKISDLGYVLEDTKTGAIVHVNKEKKSRVK